MNRKKSAAVFITRNYRGCICICQSIFGKPAGTTMHFHRWTPRSGSIGKENAGIKINSPAPAGLFYNFRLHTTRDVITSRVVFMPASTSDKRSEFFLPIFNRRTFIINLLVLYFAHIKKNLIIFRAHYKQNYIYRKFIILL
jgi:hypothetical protein